MKANEIKARKIAKVAFIPFLEDFIDEMCVELDYAAETHGTECCVFVEDIHKQFEILEEEVVEAKIEARRDKTTGWFIPHDRETNYKMELMQVAATTFQMYAAQRMKEESKKWES